MGLVGIPVFTEGGGIFYILKPSFGYIIGFCLGAYVTGYIAHKTGRASIRRFFAASVVGLIVVYFFGMLYYYILSNFYLNNYIGFKNMLIYFFLIFIPGDLISCFIAAYISKRIYSSFVKTSES